MTLFFPFVFVRLLFYRNLTYQIFGFVFDKPVIIGLDIILVYILLPYNVIVSYWYNLFSRNWLFDADAYAVRLINAKNLRSTLIKLYKHNRRFPQYDQLYSEIKCSVPTLVQRLKKIK